MERHSLEIKEDSLEREFIDIIRKSPEPEKALLFAFEIVLEYYKKAEKEGLLIKNAE